MKDRDTIDLPSEEWLRRAIIKSLKQQGYFIRNGSIRMIEDPSKDYYRVLNEKAVARKLEISKPGLVRYENKLLNYIANGWEVEPKHIAPKIVYVQPNTENELLFRYASLHWSIPVSSGYGRRLRFLTTVPTFD